MSAEYQRKNDALILDSLNHIDARLIAYDKKMDAFNENFDRKISALHEKLNIKVEMLICHEKDIGQLKVDVVELKEAIDPEIKQQHTFAILAGILAFLNITQIVWGAVNAYIQSHLPHP
jgi:hypothetical protein